MSVYTRLGINELNLLTDRFKLGKIQKMEGISEGVVNTNYRLFTARGNYVLTLVENPHEADALPFVAALLSHLADRGIPCPQPLVDDQGVPHFILKERAAILATHLSGRSPLQPTAQQCHEAGQMVASIHLAGADFPLHRPNPMGGEAWQALLQTITPQLQPKEPDTYRLLARELSWLKEHYLGMELPTGLCHADLFPDNTLFVGPRLGGVIDFFFACTEHYLYDLAVTLNGWCFDATGRPITGYWQAVLAGYESLRPLSPEESGALPAAARAAALRFCLSRLHDTLFPREGERVTQKDPQPFLQQLRTLQKGTPAPL
ncbi:MAG: homoserine kinase [Magnetococcales bacterium]|nr:homoserine kinase [Magnetococcales bacterium]